MSTDIAVDVPSERTGVPPDRGAGGSRFSSWGSWCSRWLTWGVKRYLYSRHHVSTDNAQVDSHITFIAPALAAFVSRVLVDDNQHVKAGDTLVVLDDRDLRSAGAGRGRSPGRGGRVGYPRACRSGHGPVAGHPRPGRLSSGRRHRGGGGLSESRRRPGALPGLAAKRSSLLSSSMRPRPHSKPPRQILRRPGGKPPPPAARYPHREPPSAARTPDWLPHRQAVDNARLQLSYAHITAPASGVIAKRNAETGALVQVGQSSDVDRPGQGRLGHGEPQGDPVDQRPGRRPGGVYRRRIPWPRSFTAKWRA